MLSCPWRWLTVYSTSGSNSMALLKSLPTIGRSKTTVSPWLTLEIRSPVWFCTATFLTLGPLAVTSSASTKMPTLSPPITNPKALQKPLLGDELVDIRVCWLLRGFDVLRGNDYGFGDILLSLGEPAGDVHPRVFLKLLLPARRIDRHPEGPGIYRAAGDAEARDVEDVLRCALWVEHEPHHVDLFAHVEAGVDLRLNASAQSATVSLLVSAPKSASVSLPAPPPAALPAPLPEGWAWMLLKLALRWSAVPEERVRAGKAYAATSTNTATRTVNEGRHPALLAEPELEPGLEPGLATAVALFEGVLPIRQAATRKPTLQATNEMAFKATVNVM